MNSLSININLALKPFTLAIDQTLPLSGITAIFGYSGAGKTSLLRTIAGLEKSAVGKITYQQEVWLNSADKINIIPNKRHVGFVFQDNRLFEHLTVLENLQYAIKLKKQTQQLAIIEREEAWKEMAKQVAHEIKNPLTPMRLMVQNFQYKFDQNDPNLKEKVNDF